MTRASQRKKLRASGVIGIDPGRSSGGIAHVRGPGDCEAWKMPATIPDMWALIKKLAPNSHLGILEKVNAMPKQGVSSTFKFGHSAGSLEALLVASGVPFVLVTPTKWQTALSCRTKGNKNITKEAAQRLFPSIKMTHALADALLLAEYGRRGHHEQ